MDNKRASTIEGVIGIWFFLSIPVCLLFVWYVAEHRYDDEIELCMMVRLSDYQSYRTCQSINGCELYEYDKKKCREKIEHEKRLANH